MYWTLKPKEREKWARLSAYITQTINTILNSYDEIKSEKTLDELHVEKYQLTKTGRFIFSHPEGAHDDRFWALALAAYAAETAPPPPSRPMARTI